jgi:two-component system chemotaxis response regulator CheB
VPGHDIIVIGASSGGVAVLTSLVTLLPETLPAAVFVVLHVRPEVPSLLPAILTRVGSLPAAHAVDGEPIRTGRIYVAPPGKQIYLDRQRVAVEPAPRENVHRPAIDPLFRTAAHHHGSRVIGVILSGALDDGVAGLQAVKEAGGIAVVQDPADAGFASMPAHAMARVAVDHCVKGVDLAALLIQLVAAPAPDAGVRQVPLETYEEVAGTLERAVTTASTGVESVLTCPECGGILRDEVRQGDLPKFHCQRGHEYTIQTMLEAQGGAVEKALLTAIGCLEERSILVGKLAENARARGHDGVAAMFDDRLMSLNRDVRVLRDLIGRARAVESVGHTAS